MQVGKKNNKNHQIQVLACRRKFLKALSIQTEKVFVLSSRKTSKTVKGHLLVRHSCTHLPHFSFVKWEKCKKSKTTIRCRHLCQHTTAQGLLLLGLESAFTPCAALLPCQGLSTCGSSPLQVINILPFSRSNCFSSQHRLDLPNGLKTSSQ